MHLPGKTVHITPKSMAVLQCLAEAPGEVVARNDILDKVWPGAAVTDDVLTQCIVELRKAFDDSASEPQFIETIPRKGFRLVAPVSGVDEKTARRHRKIVAAIVVVAIIGIAGAFYGYQASRAPPVAPNSIAVLPFTDLSPNGDQAFFSDGLTEQLTDRLAQIDALDVTDRASTRPFRERGEDIRDIGLQLSVSYLLDGSVRQIDDELRVTAKLTNVRDGLLEWSKTYPAAFDDLLVLQEQIAESVVMMVSVGLGVGEVATMAGGTRSIKAYEAFLAGEAVSDGAEPDRFAAIEHYERAVEADPEYALAWARLAEACRMAAFISNPGHLRLGERREQAISTALSLAPDSERVLDIAAKLKVFEHEYREARLLLDRIHERYEGREIPYSETYLDLSIKMGRVGDALGAIYSVQRHDPDNAVNPVLLNQFFLIVNQVDRALAEAEESYQGGQRGALPGVTVPIALASGRIEEIEKWLARVHEIQKPNNLYPMTPSELLLENLHDKDALREILHQRGHIYGDFWVSQWAVYAGDDELALEALQRSPMPWVFWSPLFNEIRRTDEFKQIVIDLGLVDYWNEFGWGNFCVPLPGDDFACDVDIDTGKRG